MKLRPFLFSALLSLATACFPASLRAQYNGSVSLLTINSTVASNRACTGVAQNFITSQGIRQFVNLGQTSHLATAVSTAAQFQMEIDGIDNLGNVFRLSDLQLGVPSSAKGGLVVTASGYMPNIQISVTCTLGATFSVSYSGSFSPQPPNIAGALLNAVEKLPFQVAAANANASTTFQTPGSNSQGTIVFQYSAGGPAGSTITVQCITNSNVNLASYVFPLSTASTPQLFTVTPSSCPFVTLTYTSGGASAVTYNLEYVFTPSGTAQTLSTANSGPSSTLPVQVVSDSVAQAFFSQASISNPANAQVVFQTNANNGARSLYYDKMFIACTATCTVTINSVSTAGLTCNGLTIGNQKISSSVTSTAAVNTGCATPPTIVQAYAFELQVAAGVPVIFDLRGLIASAGTTTGVDVTMNGAIVGVINITADWYEK